MAALYWKRPTADDLRGTKYRVSDYDDQEPQVDVWPEHWDSIMLFRRYSTQWRVGMGGAAGLDYTVFQNELKQKGVKGKKFERIMDDLGIIEMAALEHLHAESDK